MSCSAAAYSSSLSAEVSNSAAAHSSFTIRIVDQHDEAPRTVDTPDNGQATDDPLDEHDGDGLCCELSSKYPYANAEKMASTKVLFT